MYKNRKLKLIIVSVVCIALIYLFFAILPDYFKFSPLPTGGWDWIGFLGIIFGAIIALEGVSITIENENDRMREQQQLSVIPCLDINGFKEFNKDNENNIFIAIEEKNGTLMNDGYTITSDNSLPDGFRPSVNFRIKNIGLSTAFSINTFISKIDEVEGLNSIEDLEVRRREVIVGFYDKIKTSNYTRIVGGEEYNDEWQIYNTFNLSNDERSEINFVFDLSTTTRDSKFFNVIEFRYSDIYENHYYQLVYFYFDKNKVALMPMSKVYKDESRDNMSKK